MHAKMILICWILSRQMCWLWENILSYEGDFTHKVKIIRPNKLKILKDQIKGFIKELKPFSLDEISDDTLHEFLTLHHLNVEDFSEQYSEEYYHKTR